MDSDPLLHSDLLVVSPHLDDAALSCAALLARARPVRVLTVLAGVPPEGTATPGDRALGFADSAAAMRARRDEEARAFAGSPHEVELMDLLDETYLAGPRPAGDAEALAGAVRRWASAREGGVVAVPVGAGCRWGRVRERLGRVPGVRTGPVRHADHIWCRDVVLAAVGAMPRVVTVLYEELPYAWCRGGDRAAAAAAGRLGRRAVRIDRRVDRAAKARRIAAYESQVRHLHAPAGRSIDDPAVLPGIERYWLLQGPGEGRAAA